MEHLSRGFSFLPRSIARRVDFGLIAFPIDPEILLNRSRGLGRRAALIGRAKRREFLPFLPGRLDALLAPSWTICVRRFSCST